MAHPNTRLVNSLRLAAQKLKEGVSYAWGNHGACNCGILLQVVTQLRPEDILRYAHTAEGEWTELAEESCQLTGSPAGLMISHLQNLGLTSTDIHNLEYLEDREVLNKLPGGFRWLKKNLRHDVILYFETFADLLETRIPKMQGLHGSEIILKNPFPETLLQA